MHIPALTIEDAEARVAALAAATHAAAAIGVDQTSHAACGEAEWQAIRAIAGGLALHASPEHAVGGSRRALRIGRAISGPTALS
jgi:hypothetical protein